jgi:hypothetical protein
MLVVIVCVNISCVVDSTDILQMSYNFLNAGLRTTRRNDFADL